MATSSTRPAARRSLADLLADSAYATVGLGSAAVELARSLDRVRLQAPRRALELGRAAPERLRGARDRGVAGARTLPDVASREFDGLARRGRDLVGAVRGSVATGRALDRARAARSRVKAAATSVGRAAEGAAQAADRAAELVADRTKPEGPVRVTPVAVTAGPARARRRTGTAGQRPARRGRPAGARSRRRAGSGGQADLTLAELRARARELGIKGRSRMSRDELAEALRARG